jgi:hypothetical protein
LELAKQVKVNGAAFCAIYPMIERASAFDHIITLRHGVLERSISVAFYIVFGWYFLFLMDMD